MKINRTQDVHNVPNWVVAGNEHLSSLEENAKLLRSGVERLNITESNKVDEMSLCAECHQIEKCASNNEVYYYNSTWADNHISHLKEFASVCGMKSDKMIGIDPTSVLEVTASNDTIVKTASTQVKKNPLAESLKAMLSDPFKLEERSNMDHMKMANWETVTPEGKLSDKPNIAIAGGIMPLRGGEDCRISNQPALASNQNSIVDPEALDRLWNSKEESNGERLARQAKERLESRELKHKEWQAEKVAQMEADDWKAPGVVFPTEVGNVGSGISGNFMGAYSEADLQNLPEKTAGESLATQNEQRKASIQREVRDDSREWDTIKPSPSIRVSDHFTEELKKRLG